MTPHRIRATLAAAAAALAVVSAVSSCAYFNTLYNARKLFREAEKAEGKAGDERSVRDKYKDVVTKCAQMIQDYPKSRWVDDAEFLMGRSFFKQKDYDKALRKFQEIVTNFPESDYVPESVYWIAECYYRKEENTQALVFVDRFLKDYPKHKLRYDVMFLAGDINRGLGNDDAAIGYYARVAEEAKKSSVIDEARTKSAALYASRGEWEKAAASYEKVLRKGLDWSTRYEVSLALGESYAHIGKSREALLLYEGLLKQSTSTQETPLLLLGQAESYASMDSVQRALAIFRTVTEKYPKSVYSATAYYRTGLIYSDRLDSLEAAQRVFAKVGEEDANYEHARTALERSNSLKRLIELRRSSGAGVTADQAAEKRFMEAEIQLTRLDNVPLALDGYRAVLDSFPESATAPRAAYAIGWVYRRKLAENEKAVEAFRTVAARYPRSPQAKGALVELESLGAIDLRDRMQAIVDSALADTLNAPKQAAAQPGAAPRPVESGAVREDEALRRVASDTLQKVIPFDPHRRWGRFDPRFHRPVGGGSAPRSPAAPPPSPARTAAGAPRTDAARAAADTTRAQSGAVKTAVDTMRARSGAAKTAVDTTKAPAGATKAPADTSKAARGGGSG